MERRIEGMFRYRDCEPKWLGSGDIGAYCFFWKSKMTAILYFNEVPVSY